MKYFIALISLVLILSSCFGSESVDETGLVEYSNTNFSMLVPESWDNISAEDLPSPQSGEIVFALSSGEERQGYINNVVVLKSEKTKNESSISLMKNNVNFLSEGLEGFTLLKEEDIIFPDNQTGILLTFSAKYNKQTPELVYLQTARSCPDASYFITLSLAEKLEDYSRYAYLFKSFECK